MVTVAVNKTDDSGKEEGKKEAIKYLTKDHKAKIKLFNNEFVAYVKGFKNFLTSEGRSEIDEDVINTLKGILGYIKTYKNLSLYELESLADTLLQEDPVTPLTPDTYNEIKNIVRDSFSEHIDVINRNIREELSSKLPRTLNTKTLSIDLQTRISDLTNDEIFRIMEEMDEVVNIQSLDDIEELKEENARLKAELAAYKKAIADVKKKFS